MKAIIKGFVIGMLIPPTAWVAAFGYGFILGNEPITGLIVVGIVIEVYRFIANSIEKAF